MPPFQGYEVMPPFQGYEVMAVMQGWEVMAGHAGLGKDFFEISSEMFGGMG